MLWMLCRIEKSEPWWQPRLTEWWHHQMETFSALLALCEGNPLTKTSDAELRSFLWSPPEQRVELSIETPMIWDAIALIMTVMEWKVVSGDKMRAFVWPFSSVQMASKPAKINLYALYFVNSHRCRLDIDPIFDPCRPEGLCSLGRCSCYAGADTPSLCCITIQIRRVVHKCKT